MDTTLLEFGALTVPVAVVPAVFAAAAVTGAHLKPQRAATAPYRT